MSAVRLTPSAAALLWEYFEALVALLRLPPLLGGGYHHSNTANDTLLPACARDSSLPPLAAATDRYLLAANLHNSRAVLPNFIVQLSLLASQLPPGALFVSVYESGSTDRSEAWLEELRHLLHLMEVPHRIVTGGAITQTDPAAAAAAAASSANVSERIEMMAALRNAALAPLLELQHQQQHNKRLHKLGRSSSTSAASGSMLGFVPDFILFVNDVFW